MNAQVPAIQGLRVQLGSMASEIASALPSHIRPEKFQRVVLTVAQQNPDLLAADRKTLLGSCLKCAADGLIPDGREAALVIFNTKMKVNNKDQWVKAVQYMPMLAGVQKRVRNSGEVSSIESHVIYANDHFVWRQGLDASVEHTPFFPGDRGKPIGAYAVAKFKDGSAPQFEVMDIAAIEKVRGSSRSKDRGPWVDWWDEMARKTVFRRLAKWLPMDADVDDLLERDIENERAAKPAIDTHAEAEPAALSAPSKLDALQSDDNAIEGTAEVMHPADAALENLAAGLRKCGTISQLEHFIRTADADDLRDSDEHQARWTGLVETRRRDLSQGAAA